MLLSLPGDNTRANFEEANRAFWRQTVIPLIARGEPGSTRFDIYQRDDALRRICVYDVYTGAGEKPARILANQFDALRALYVNKGIRFSSCKSTHADASVNVRSTRKRDGHL